MWQGLLPLLVFIPKIIALQINCTKPEDVLGPEKKVDDFQHVKQLCTTKPGYVVDVTCQQKNPENTITEIHSLAEAWSQLKDLYNSLKGDTEHRYHNDTSIADAGIVDRLKAGECSVKAGDDWHPPTTAEDKNLPGACIAIQDSALKPLKYKDMKYTLDGFDETIAALWHGIGLNELPINTCSFDYSFVVEDEDMPIGLCTGYFVPFKPDYLNVDTKAVSVPYPVDQALLAAFMAGA